MPGARTRSQAPAKAPEVSLARVGFIAIPPGEKPGFDHADVHRQRRRIYVAHTGADRIDVLDCNARSYLRALPAELPGQVEVGPHPNGLAYDLKRRRLYSFNLGEPLGQHWTASVVELDPMVVHAELTLPGRPRWALYDRERDV